MYDSSAEGDAPEAGAPDDSVLAKAIYDAMQAGSSHAYMLPFDDAECMVIDGNFNLLVVARHLRALL